MTAKGAVISDDERYRYLLYRVWGAGPSAAFVMLNPSTADAHVDTISPTVDHTASSVSTADALEPPKYDYYGNVRDSWKEWARRNAVPFAAS